MQLPISEGKASLRERAGEADDRLESSKSTRTIKALALARTPPGITELLIIATALGLCRIMARRGAFIALFRSANVCASSSAIESRKQNAYPSGQWHICPEQVRRFPGGLARHGGLFQWGMVVETCDKALRESRQDGSASGTAAKHLVFVRFRSACLAGHCRLSHAETSSN